ncbi:GRIP and coiled-coil domain-containing protein 2-like [Mytilus edulis]|uniref:GRIP and coiled-coil domain-containing protein 2-like n=1 Tax=Mytilus edulis TaxID=6550 RepID=UPI0039EEF17C
MIDISKPKEQFYFRFHFQKVNIDYSHINNQIMASRKMGNEMIKPTEENQNMASHISSDLNRQAEENQKRVKDLISQLRSASNDENKIMKSFQDANKQLRAQNDKKDAEIKSLHEDKIKTKMKNTLVQKEYHQQTETDKKLQEAKKTIETLEKQSDEKERNYLKTIQDLDNKLSESSVDPKIEEGCFIDHHKNLEDEVKHLTIENKEHRDRINTLETKCQRLQELNSTLEQEKNTLKQQIDTWVAKKHSTVHIQMYAAVNKELCDKMMTELEDMLSTQFELNDSIIEIEKYKDPPPDSRVPLIVICINASRLGTDVNQALSHVNRSRTTAVVVLHHKEYHALPRQPSEKMLIGSDYKHIGAIVDIAYLTTKGVYPCDMNEKSLDRLVNFIKVNSQSK